MEKRKLLSILMPLFAMSLVGCGNGEDKGEAKREFDSSGHWIVEADGTKGAKEKHTLVEDASKAKTATCKDEGEKVEVCSVCGYEKKSSVSKLNHNYVEDASAYKAPTCKDEGEKVEKCSVCSDVKKTTLPKSAHTLGAGTGKTDDKGREYTEYTCSTCNAVVSTRIAFNTFEVTKGTFDDGKISKEPVEGEIAWKVQLPAGDYDVYFEAKFSSSSSAANRTFETRKVNLNYNDVDVDYDKSKTAEDLGMSNSEYKAFTFCSITATGNVDTMKLSNPNYRLIFDTDGYIVFKPVARVA